MGRANRRVDRRKGPLVNWWYYRVWAWGTGVGVPHVVGVLPQAVSPAGVNVADLAFVAAWRSLLLPGGSCRVLADRVDDPAEGTPGFSGTFSRVLLIVGQPCAAWAP